MNLLCVLVSAILFQAGAFGQFQLSYLQKNILDSISMQDVPIGAPGIATAVISDGMILYEKFGGYADLKDSTLITAETRFNLASNGKQFTALAILTLVEEGKLRLSDDIREFLPGLYRSCKEHIPIQSLLNHTSGLRDCYDLWSLQGYTWWQKSFSNKDVLALIQKQEDFNFKPNSRYLYSNTNYILLALIIEKATGQSFTVYTGEMFKKLNMPNTAFENEATDIRGPIARAYFNFGTWTTYDWIWNVCGDGNLFSTLEDQVQWEKIVQGKVKTAFKQDLVDKSQQIIKGSAFTNYGYGLEFAKYKGLNCVFHEGATGAWKATVLRFPEKKISMITLTNTGKAVPSMQTRQLADVIFGLEGNSNYLTKPAKVGKPLTEQEIAGIYLTTSDFSFQFELREGNKLWLKRQGRNDVELEREADNIFHQKFDTAFKQEFITKRNGELQVTVYYTDHAPYTLKKQKSDFSKVSFNKYSGRYMNVETGAFIQILYEADTNFDIKISTRNSTKGQLISSSKLLANGYTFHFNVKEYEINSFRLNGERIKSVQFVKVRD